MHIAREFAGPCGFVRRGSKERHTAAFPLLGGTVEGEWLTQARGMSSFTTHPQFAHTSALYASSRRMFCEPAVAREGKVVGSLRRSRARASPHRDSSAGRETTDGCGPHSIWGTRRAPSPWLHEAHDCVICSLGELRKGASGHDHHSPAQTSAHLQSAAASAQDASRIIRGGWTCGPNCEGRHAPGARQRSRSLLGRDRPSSMWCR